MPTNDDYVSRPGQKNVVPVQSDDAPVKEMDAATANSDAELSRCAVSGRINLVN